MNEEKTVDKPTDLALDVDVIELGKRLEGLLARYRVAIKIVDGWKFIERNAVEGQKRLILKPLTKWYLEAHIRSRLVSISRALRIEKFRAVNQIDGDLHKKLSGYLEILEEASEVFFKWGNLLVFFTSLPLILTLLSPLIVGSVIDFTSYSLGNILNEFMKALGQLFFSGDTGKALLILLLIFPFTVLLASIIGLVEGSFLAKRKIFLGQKIYELETEVYKSLRVNKPIEFPLDTLINPALVYLFGMLIALFFILATNAARGFDVDIELKILIVIYSLISVIPICKAFHIFASRKKSGRI